MDNTWATTASEDCNPWPSHLPLRSTGPGMAPRSQAGICVHGPRPHPSVSTCLALAQGDILVHPVLSLSLSWKQPFLQGAWFLLVRTKFRKMGTRDSLMVPRVSTIVDLSRQWDTQAQGYVCTHLYLFLDLPACTYSKQLVHTDTSGFNSIPRAYYSIFLFLFFYNVPLQRGEIWFPLSAIDFLICSIQEYTQSGFRIVNPYPLWKTGRLPRVSVFLHKA